MKKVFFFFLCFLTLGASAAFGESYRRTTTDMLMESYAASMRRQTGMGPAETGASQYTPCDEHHNCGGRVRRSRMAKEMTKPMLQTPAWG